MGHRSPRNVPFRNAEQLVLSFGTKEIPNKKNNNNVFSLILTKLLTGKRRRSVCVLLLPHVAEAVSTPVTLLRCYIITHTKLNAHVSWPRRTSTATQRSGELASLATGSQVD